MLTLIEGIKLLSMGSSKEIINDTNIYIQDDKIVHIGDLKREMNPDRIIDGKDKLAMPGLINAHTHISMSLMRNFADDLPLQEWLTQKIWPVESHLTAEDVYWGAMLSIVEMIQSGTTCFADMYFFMDEVGKAIEESGIRGMISRGITEEDDEEKNEEKIKDTRNLYNSWNGKADGRIKVFVAPHAPYTCGVGFLEKALNLAKELNTAIHIHLSETKREVDDSLRIYGKSPIKHVYDIGLFDVPTLAAHCVHVSPEDIEILKEKNVNVVNNPGSNLKLASGFAPVVDMLKAGVNVALGTDGSSSNNNLNMFEEINLAAIINKGITGIATAVPAIKAVEMATVNGAKSLLWENEIGTIEAGKKADIILIDMNKPHLYPMHDIISSLAYTVQGSDVDTVIVNGKVIMEKREMKTMDVEKIKYNAEKSAESLIRR